MEAPRALIVVALATSKRGEGVMVHVWRWRAMVWWLWKVWVGGGGQGS